MLRQIKRSLLVAITIGVVMGCSAPAFAERAWFQEWYTNETGQDAYDIEKVLWGTRPIIAAYSNVFPYYSVEYVAGFTIIKWYGDYVSDKVAPGETVMVCFETDAGVASTAEISVLCAMWTDQNGDFMGYAGAGATITAQIQTARVTVTVRHSGKEYEGHVEGEVLAPITVSHVYFTTADRLRSLEELDDGLFWKCEDGANDGEFCDPGMGDCPDGTCVDNTPADIMWMPAEEMPGRRILAYDESVTYDIDKFPPRTVLLFRFDAEGTGDTSHARELIQFRMEEGIPAVSEWGMIVIALLVLAAGTVVIRRRRAMAA